MEVMPAARDRSQEFRGRAIRLLGALPASDECDDHRSERGSGSSHKPWSDARDSAEVSDVLQTAAAPSGRERMEVVRRRVLIAQLARLADRAVDAGPASRDAAARAVRVAQRLKHDELEW